VRLRFPALALLAGLVAGAPAQAQMYPGEDVTVNPSATGSRVLLYPGGKYSRVVQPLLQPGEPDPNAPIRLHMPLRHRAIHRVARAKPKVETAAALPRRQQTAPEETMPFSALPSESASTLVAPEPAPPAPKKSAPPPQPKKVATAKPAPAPAKPKVVAKAPAPASDSDMTFLSGQPSAPVAPAPAPAKVASNEPAPASTANMARRNSISFSPGAEEPAPAVLDTVKAMSGDLNNALANGSARIQLQAYGGKQNDKSSDARRLSLKRALIIRQLLIDNGVPSERIDVRAMGGASDGAPDRVDIFLRT
jgi:outer membrane protein OmpA-like peptidoglycan-associated protein